MNDIPDDSRKAGSPFFGVICSASAFTAWGILTIFWKLFGFVPVFELLAHRILWSAVFLLLILGLRGSLPELMRTLRDRKARIALLFSTIAIAINWAVYVYSMSSGNVVQASLGYYMNPLVSIFLGLAVLRERLTPTQAAAVGLAAVGVLLLSLGLAGFPWIALTLSFAFGSYGLIKKLVHMDPRVSLALESTILSLAAGAFLIVSGIRGDLVFGAASPVENLLLVLAGPVTVLPLLLFIRGTQLIPLSRVGFLQFIAPTMMLLLGVLLYGEPFTRAHLIGFLFIWAALIVFTAAEGARYRGGGFRSGR